MNQFCSISRLLLVLFLLMPLPLAAQGAVSGTLRGTVLDSTGAPVPGATVTVKSEALVRGTAGAVTDASGSFNFPSLPPGVYSVEAALPGFRGQKKEEVRISLGQALSLPFRLDLAPIASEVVVTAETPQVSVVSNAVSSNVTAEFLERQPVGRSFASVINYTPGVNGGLAFGGTQTATNAYNLDGVNVSDPASGDQWILPNVDWIKEVQVTGLGADAEYGGFTGAAINLVTKSGGNKVAGDLTAYFSGGGLSSTNSSDPALSPQKTDSYTDVALNAGGPVVKDALWLFASAQEVRSRITYQGASNDEYTKLSRYLLKLTGQVDEKTRIVGLLDYDGKVADRRGISQFRLESASTRQDSPNFTYNLSAESALSSRAFLELKATGFQGSDDRIPYGGDAKGRQDDYTGIFWANNAFTNTQAKKRFAVDGAFSYFADGLVAKNDSHRFKAGANWEQARADETNRRNGAFTFYDDSSYCSSTAAYFKSPDCALYSSDQGNEIFLKGTQRGINAYAQDTWQVSRLTVNLGVRYTNYKAGFAGGNEGVYSVSNWSPRVGLVFDILGDASTALKAHWGRYYEGMFTYLYDREAAGAAFTPYDIYDYNFKTSQFDIFVKRTKNAAALDPNIGHPYMNQLVLSLERQVSRDVAIGLDYASRKSHDISALVNANNDYDPQVTVGNPLGGAPVPFFDLNSNPVNVLTNPADAYRDYNAVTLRAGKRYANGWAANASVVWADLKGNSFKANGYVPEWVDKNGQVNADGKLPGYSRWEGKLSASVDLPLGFLASGYYRFLSGETWTPYVQVRGLYKNDRSNIFIEPRGSEKLPDRQLVDLRLSKSFTLSGSFRLSLYADAFNVFNSSTVTSVDTNWGRYNYNYKKPSASTFSGRAAYGAALAIETPREVRLGARFSF
ncbi:MAG: TonB-dependent receptor [Acidobacteriota bacterium]|nr:TonB-dependent receptor [Acidobacteriota bacterium]